MLFLFSCPLFRKALSTIGHLFLAVYWGAHLQNWGRVSEKEN